MTGRTFMQRVPGRIALGLTIGLLTGVVSGNAQELGDPKRGHAYVSRVCAECHAVLADDANSRNPRATPFSVFAQVPGLTERALMAFLQTPHKDMPNLIVPRNEQDDVAAYIMSLRQRR